MMKKRFEAILGFCLGFLFQLIFIYAMKFGKFTERWERKIPSFRTIR